MRYIFVGFLFSLFACQEETRKNFQSECSSISAQNNETIIDNCYYQTINNQEILAIKEKIVFGDTSGLSTFQVSKMMPDNEAYDWSVNFEGRSFDVVSPLLIVETSELNSNASYQAYSLINGSKVLEYTYDKFEVLFSDKTKKRMIGFYSNQGATSKFLQENSNKKTFGILSYGSQDELLNSIRIDAADPMWMDVIDISSPVIELLPIKENAISLYGGKTLFFTSHDGVQNDELNFDVKIVFYTTDTYKPVEFVLEVRDNQLLLPESFSHSVFHLESL